MNVVVLTNNYLFRTHEDALVKFSEQDEELKKLKE